MMKRLPILLLITLLAACSGGTTSNQNAPIGASNSLPPASGTGTVRLTITIPSKTTASTKRSAKYISPNARSAAISLYPVVAGVISPSASTTSNQDLAAGTPGCSGSPVTCSIQLSSAPGIVAFGIKLYDAPGQTGSILSQLDPSVATERTIAAGIDNAVVPLVLSGVPSTITLALASNTLQGGVSNTITLVVVARDADSNMIIGSAPYETPITLSASDPAITFSPASVISPSTAVTLNYNGHSTPTSDTVSATAGAAMASPAPLTFTPATLLVSCGSGCAGVPNTSTPYAVAINELGYSGTATLSVSGTGCVIDSSSALVSNGSGSFNLYPDPKGGNCQVTATDTYSQVKTGTLGFVAAGYPSTVVCVTPAPPVPTDPNGGVLSVYPPCNTAVKWGSYTYVPLQSHQNPITFQIAAYANTTQAALFQTQISNNPTIGGNRYITSTSPSGTSTTVTFTGQGGASNVDLALFTP